MRGDRTARREGGRGDSHGTSVVLAARRGQTARGDPRRECAAPRDRTIGDDFLPRGPRVHSRARLAARSARSAVRPLRASRAPHPGRVPPRPRPSDRPPDRCPAGPLPRRRHQLQRRREGSAVLRQRRPTWKRSGMRAVPTSPSSPGSYPRCSRACARSTGSTRASCSGATRAASSAPSSAPGRRVAVGSWTSARVGSAESGQWIDRRSALRIRAFLRIVRAT